MDTIFLLIKNKVVGTWLYTNTTLTLIRSRIMILTNDNDFETRGDTFIEVSPLEQLSRELLDEFITIQIQQPFEMKTNFVENFTEEVELLMLNNAEDEDYLEQIKQKLSLSTLALSIKSMTVSN